MKPAMGMRVDASLLKNVPDSNITESNEWNSVIQRVQKVKNAPAAIEIACLGNVDVGKTSL